MMAAKCKEQKGGEGWEAEREEKKKVPDEGYRKIILLNCSSQDIDIFTFYILGAFL